jgi:riboflavin-specific deaminase-like protein
MFVFSNLAISLDGKIATRRREFLPLGTSEDRRHMVDLRRQCDAVLMGASTLRTFRRPCLTPPGPHPINVVLSSSLQGLSLKWPFFTASSLQRILITGHDTPKSVLKKFEKTSQIIVLKKPTPRNSVSIQTVALLEREGIHRLLVEGGGNTMWDFAEKNLINEYHVTLTPKILGGRDSPTLVDGEGFQPKDILNLKLKQSRIVGDEIYLVYLRTKK